MKKVLESKAVHWTLQVFMWYKVTMKLYLKNNFSQLGLKLHSLIHIECALFLKKKQTAFVENLFSFLGKNTKSAREIGFWWNSY